MMEKLQAPPAPASMARRRLALPTAALLLLASAMPHGATPAAAQARQAESPEELINWYYAAVFGTGVYQAGDRTVGILQLPFAYTWRPATAERWGVKLTVPVTFGFYDFQIGDLAEGDLPESVSTASVLPGIELQMQALDNWRLQPFAAVGYGWELDGPADAVLYHVGVKSQLAFPLGRGQFILGNTLSHAGYDASDQPRQPLTRFITGLNFVFPSNGTLAGRPIDFGMHVIHYLYATKLAFPLAEDVDNTTRNEIEVGISFRARQPFTFGAFDRELFDVDQVGLAFRVGENVTGVRLFFSLPY
jgi:hypothetical protein